MKKNKPLPKGKIGGKRICIFDLEFMQYLYQSRARPGMYPMLISSFYREKGYEVVFTTEIPNFTNYEIVFINRDAPDLWYDPDWLTNANVKLTGAYWPSDLIYYDLEWEFVNPDITIFHNWVENRLKKYPSLKKNRFNEFYKTPFKMIRGKRIVEPEGSNLLIIDDNLQLFEGVIDILKYANITNTSLSYNLFITKENVWEVFDFLNMKTISRDNLTVDILEQTEDGLQEIMDAWNSYRMGRTVRLKYHLVAQTQEEWEKKIIYACNMAQNFKIQTGKRVYMEPHDRESFKYPLTLTFLKRWTGKDMGFAKNSLIDYWIYDVCKTYEAIEDFLENPKETKKSSLETLVNFLEEYYDKNPELIKAMTCCRVAKFG